jgi:hypothetical protein
MYTLRAMKTVLKNGKRLQVDTYWCNLSTDWELAVHKAKQESMSEGVPLENSKKFSLEEIKRQRDSERKAIAQEHAEKERALVAQQIKLLEEQTETSIAEGILLVGMYKGLNVDDVFKNDSPYVRFMASKIDSSMIMDKHGITCKICNEYVEKLEPLSLGHIGTVGETIEGFFTFFKRVYFRSRYGSNSMHIFMDESVSEVILYTSAKKFLELEKGQMVNLSATVQEHRINHSLSTPQTIITKAKILKVMVTNT